MAIGDDAGERCAEVGEVAKGGEKKEKRHQLLRPRSPSFLRFSLTSFFFSLFFQPRLTLPSKTKKTDNWALKAARRKTTGTGRMRHLKDLPRRAKNGFREGSQAEKKTA